MNRRAALRSLLNAMLAFALVATGVTAPAWKLATTVASAQETGISMPCSDMGNMTMPASPGEPKGHAPAHPCDLSACLGTACTPSFLRVMAYIPPATPTVPDALPLPPSVVIDTPLRPPIV